MCQIL